MANTSETGDAREALDGMPGEVDFSESLPNPYVGKARRRVDATADDGVHGRAAEDQWHDPLRRPSSSDGARRLPCTGSLLFSALI